MLFNHVDLKDLKDNLEYIDTAIIPVANIDMNNQLLTSCDHSETVQLVGMLTEKQFKGRLLLTPTFFTSNMALAHVESFINNIQSFGLSKVIILSTEQLNLNDSAHIYHLNTIPMGDLDDDMKKTLINDEVKQFMKYIIKIWNSN